MNTACFVPPMKARPAAELPQNPGWLFEIKFDGIRALSLKNGRDIRLFSRQSRDLTGEFPDIVEDLRKIHSGSFVLEGEIVALDDQGRSSFQLLQNRDQDAGIRARIRYYLFDLLQLDGKDLMPLPLRRRKQLLKRLLLGRNDKLRFSPALDGSPNRIWKRVRQLGLEGVMAKREDSRYEPDRRSGAWLKVKTGGEQEFVVGGYTAPKGSRQFFGAVLVGYYKNGQLTFASKIGTGCDEHALKTLYETFRGLKTDRCPFAAGISREFSRPELGRCSWLKPQLVCQVKFAEWTQDGKLRQPVFLGLRDDKNPKDAVRELPE
jgi:bifunctional non-homologous end joining protein LigD